jgi:NADPH-dependent glutamate synthase beta subunit-like oxidoreductase
MSVETPDDRGQDAATDTGDARVRVAIIGSGPAGSYAAGHLLRHSARELHVDLFERLPTA